MKTSSIRHHVLAGVISLALASLGLWAAIWIVLEYSHFKVESESLRERYLEAQQETLRGQVGTAVDYVRYMIDRTEARLKTSIRERAHEAWCIAHNIHSENRDTRSPAEIRTMIKDALRPIRFNNGRGYFFAFQHNGIAELRPDRPEEEGRNMLGVTGPMGENVVRDMLDLVLAQREGFYEYTWTKPSETQRHHPKIAFVTLFEPYGWVIGAGEYLEDVKSQVQDEVLHRLTGIRFGEERYLFGSTFDGDPLFSNGKIITGSEKIGDLTDSHGVKIFQEQLKEAKRPGGGFVRYSWPKLESSEPVAKLSYVLGIPEWQWIIGGGIYLDTIETEIAGKRDLLRRNLTDKIQRSVLTFLPLLLLVFLWVRYLSSRMKSGFLAFSGFLERAATQSITIDPDELYFQEFRKLAQVANQMVLDRKQAEEALRESEARYKSLFENNHAVMLLIDPDDGAITDANPAATAYYGWSREELRRMKINEINTLSPAEIHAQMQSARSARREPFHFKHRWADGTVRDVEVYSGPIRVGGKSLLYSIIHDITERVRGEEERLALERQVHQAQKRASLLTMAGAISHHFNNLLFAVLGNLEMAREELPPESETAIVVMEAEQAARRAAELSRLMMTYVGKGVNPKERLDLARQVEELLPRIRGAMPGNVRLESDLPPGRCYVTIDPDDAMQMVIHLVTNAWEAVTQKEGVVRVAVYPVAGEDSFGMVRSATAFADQPLRVCLEVTDSGKGMDKETQDRIFDPFFTTKSMGRGLGLAVTQGIARSYKGSTLVESEPARGTTVRVLFPAAERPDLDTGGER